MSKNCFFAKLAGLSFTVLTVLGAGQVKAQENSPGPNFGIKGGLNFSQLYIDQPNVEDEKIKLGLHFGIFGKIPITNFLGIQPEVLYTNVGSKTSYGGTDLATTVGIEPGEVRFNLNYIQVPIALAINAGPLNFHGGPYFAYLVSANVKDLKTSTLNPNPTLITDLNVENFNRFDYGLMGGLAVDVKGLTVGARYNYGLREVGKNGLAGTLTDNSKNSVVQVYVGFGL